MTGAVSSPGIGSKLDVKTIVSQLTAVEHRPVDVLVAHRKTVQARLSSFGLLKNFLGNLKDAAGTVADASLWRSTTAASSAPAVATVATKPGAATGSYRVAVERLAQAQTLVSAPVADTRADLGAGTLRIETGAWNDDASTFAPKAGADAVTIALPAAPSSLEAVRDRINAAKSGVAASILRDANGARLVLTSTATGAANAARITATGPADGDPPPPGLAALAYDPPSGTAGLARAQAALDARATVNGVAVTTAGNVLDGAVEGLSITLRQAGASAELEVSTDTAGMKKALAAFVGAFNDASGYIATQSAYDATTKKGAPLQGDAATLQLHRLLRGALADASGASSAFPRLLDVGLHLGAANTLAIDDRKLAKALAHPAELEKAFARRDPGGHRRDDGFGVRFADLAGAVLGSDGLVGRRDQALKDQVARSQEQQDRMEVRVSDYQARLLKQYTALDGTMATLTAQSNDVTQQMAALAKNSK